MTEPPDPKHRRQWLAMLAKLTAPMNAVLAAKALADMIPMLADLPDAAFTTDSLDHVASQCQRVPAYGELRGMIWGWWQQHRPAQPLLANPDGALERERRHHADSASSWQNTTASDIRAKIADVRRVPTASLQLALGQLLSKAIRTHVPAMQFLIPLEWQPPANDPRAA